MLGVKIADLFAGFRLDVDEKSWAAGDKLLTGIKAGLGALAAWQGFQWARGLIDQTTELGGKIADLSQKVGVPAETLQQLGYAAQLSGSSMEELGNSLGKLSKLAYDANKGGKEAADAFKKVGVSVKGSDGSLRSADELLADIADHVAALPDGTEKTAKAMALFGRSGKDLIPLLNEGGDGIAALRKEFVELGAQIDGETASALEEFGDQQDKVKVAFDGIRNQAVIALLPTLRELVDAFLGWVKANRELIKQRLTTLLTAVVKVMQVLLKAFNVFMKAVDVAAGFLSNWFEIITENWHLITQAAFAAAGAMAAFKWQAIQAAIATMAAWAVPIAAIAGILLLVEDIWVWSKGGNSAIGRLHQGMVDVFVKAIEFWVKEFDDFVDYMVKRLKSIPQSLKDGVTEFFTGDTVRENSVGSAVDVGRQIAGNRAEARQLAWSEADRQFLGASPVWQQQHPERDPRIRQATINAPITINGTGMDAATIAKAVQDKLDAAWRGAKAALDEED